MRSPTHLHRVNGVLLSSAFRYTPPARHRRLPGFRDSPGIKENIQSVTRSSGPPPSGAHIARSHAAGVYIIAMHATDRWLDLRQPEK